MTLKDIIMEGITFITDETKITVTKPLVSNLKACRSGNWYQDNILEWMDEEVDSFTWSKENGLYITLKGYEA